jgi:hypothetical protein
LPYTSRGSTIGYERAARIARDPFAEARKDELWKLIGYALEDLIATSAPKTLQAQ